MQYDIVEEDNTVIIRISGTAGNNEAMRAKRSLAPYFNMKGIRLILDLREVKDSEVTNLIGLLNSIRRVNFARGGLKMCSLPPRLLHYVREHRFDAIFDIYDNVEQAKQGEWRNGEKSAEHN